MDERELPKNEAVPLTDPSGAVRAYACPRCFRVRLGVTAGGPKGREIELEHLKESAERCGRCRDCGVETECSSWEARCKSCKTTYHAKMNAHLEADRPVWEARRKARDLELQKARDYDAAMRLVELMSSISENHYCAGWMSGNEYTLWAMVLGGPRSYGFSDVDEDLIKELKRLSERCDGWFYFSDALRGETFVPTADWKKMYEQRGGTYEGE